MRTSSHVSGFVHEFLVPMRGFDSSVFGTRVLALPCKGGGLTLECVGAGAYGGRSGANMYQQGAQAPQQSTAPQYSTNNAAYGSGNAQYGANQYGGGGSSAYGGSNAQYGGQGQAGPDSRGVQGTMYGSQMQQGPAGMQGPQGGGVYSTNSAPISQPPVNSQPPACPSRCAYLRLTSFP